MSVEAILLTHTHFDHVGAVAPRRPRHRRAGLLPELETPRARRHQRFVPVARLRPVRVLRRRPHRRRRRDARARRHRHRRDLHARPQPGPRDLRDRGRAARCSRGDVLFQGSVGRVDLPGGDWADAARARSPRCSTRFPTRRASTRATWGITTLGRERATNPFLRELAARLERAHPGPARHVRRAAARTPRATAGGDARSASSSAAGYSGIETPIVRGDRAVRPRGGGGHRHRPEGDVHVRRRRRAVADAAARGHGAGVPRLPRARHAQAAAAGEALVPGPLLPPRAPADRPLPPVLAGRRRGDRLRRPGRRRRDRSCCSPSCSRRSAPATRLRLVEPRHARRRAPPTASELQAYLRAHEDAAVRGGARRASTSTRCARSTPSTRGRSAVMADAPRLLDRLDAEDREHFDERHGAARRRRARLRARPDARARPRLLHAHGVRVRVLRRSGAQSGVGGGGRYDGLMEQLGGPPTPGIGWAAGSSGCCSPRRQPPAAPPASTSTSPWPSREYARERLRLAAEARRAGLNAQTRARRPLAKGQLKQADRAAAPATLRSSATRAASAEGHGQRRAARDGARRGAGGRAARRAAGCEAPARRTPTATPGPASCAPTRAGDAGARRRLGAPPPRPRRADLHRPARPLAGSCSSSSTPSTRPRRTQRAHALRSEHVLTAAGAVVRREEGNVNPNLATGEIELVGGRASSCSPTPRRRRSRSTRTPRSTRRCGCATARSTCAASACATR